MNQEQWEKRNLETTTFTCYFHMHNLIGFSQLCAQKGWVLFVPHLQRWVNWCWEINLTTHHYLTFPASRTSCAIFPLLEFFLLRLAKIQLYFWGPDQMWLLDTALLALWGTINPFLYSPLTWFISFHQHSNPPLCHQLCLHLVPWADTGLHDGKG